MQCFAHWRRETKDCLDLQEIADQKREEKDVDLIQDSLANWGERFRSIVQLRACAIELYQHQLLRYEFEGCR